MTTTEQPRVIVDTAAICLELIGGQALCRECTIDPQGSIPELDFRSFSSRSPEEFSAHLLKHEALRQELPAELLELSYWRNILGTTQRS